MTRFSVFVWLVLSAAMTGCSSAPASLERTTLARLFLESRDLTGARTILPQSETVIFVAAKPVFTEFDFVEVEISETELGKCLSFRFTAAAARDLYRLSVVNVGQRLVLTVDGNAMGARRIQRPVEDGRLLVFVETPDDRLPALQESLQKTSAEYQRVARKL